MGGMSREEELQVEGVITNYVSSAARALRRLFGPRIFVVVKY